MFFLAFVFVFSLGYLAGFWTLLTLLGSESERRDL
jgi:hypothetical protein